MSELLGEGWEMGCLGYKEMYMDQKLRTQQETDLRPEPAWTRDTSALWGFPEMSKATLDISL